jgi:hypothetical protein
MHPRNPFYNNTPDFGKLREIYPEFSKFCIKKADNQYTIDFKKSESLKALCCVLLKDLFKLTIDLPLDHLIPTVPQRINYTLWIEDLLARPNTATGLDIGREKASILINFFYLNLAFLIKAVVQVVFML